MSVSLPVTIDDIEVAARRISGRVLTTPLAMSGSLSELCGVPVGLKLEHHQTTGSFKLRGATNAVLSLSAGDRALGVIAASTAIMAGHLPMRQRRKARSLRSACRTWCP